MTLRVTARNIAPIPLNVSFSVNPGELLALVGPSGSGKTTLLRVISGLCRPDRAFVSADGETWLDTEKGIDLPPYRRRVGVVFQSYALFPHMSARQNILAAMDRAPREHMLREADRLLSLVNLTGLGDRKPRALSGGQQQRVALARALARRPNALLLDEPFSAVDRPTRNRLHGEIMALRRHLSMPVVLVTHDLNEAQLLSDRMMVIENGRSVAVGTTGAVMSDPSALRGLGIREVASMLSARVAEHEADGLTRLETAAGPLFLPHLDSGVGELIRVRIMAHEVILSRDRPTGLSAHNILPATVIDIRQGDGPGAIVRLRVGDEDVLARITRRSVDNMGLAPGVMVHVILKAMSVARDHVATNQDAGTG
jgi:molybdate transport system ATP-binding protein